MVNNLAQKPDLDEKMLSELNSIDSFHGLSDWMVIVDRRKKNPEREKRDEEIISFIDSTCSGIVERKIDQFNVLDDELRSWMIKIILMADRQRERQNLSPYSEDSILTLVYEIWYTAHLHRDNFRQSGENYAKSHLFESVINGIRDHAVSDIITIVSILRHDDLEDWKKLGFDKPRPDLLLCLHYYEYLLNGEEMPSPIEDQIDNFRKKVISTVEAVSIYKKFSKERKQEKHELNFRRALKALVEYGVRPTKVRLAERKHNHETINAKPEDEAEGYVRRSLSVYPALTRFLDMDRSNESLITSGYEYLDSALLKTFEEIREKRLNQRFGENKDQSKLLALLKKVAQSESIKFLAVNPKKISDYVRGSEGSEALKDISETDPMFEVVILVENEEDLEGTKARIEACLKTSDEFLDIDLDYSREAKPQRGIHMEILNPDPDPEVGGYLNVRINTVADEAKLDQGRIDGSEVEDDKEMLRPIKDILERTSRSAKGILEMVDEISRGTSDVFTPNRHKISIPTGGTSLAFAANINTKMVGEIRGARIEVKREDKQGKLRRVWLPISPLDPIKHKSRIKIIKDGDKDYDKKVDTYEINYAWLEFAKSLDAQAIRKYFNSLPEPERNLKLSDYFVRLGDLFGLELVEVKKILFSRGQKESPETVRTIAKISKKLARLRADVNEDDGTNKNQTAILNLEKKQEVLLMAFQKEWSKMLEDVSNGHLSPLKVISNLAEDESDPIKIDRENPLELYFVVPDREGVAREISNEFEKLGVNFRFISQTSNNGYGQDRLQLSLDIRNPNTRIYDLLLALLKLSERYKCVVVSGTFKKLVPDYSLLARSSEPRQ